MKNIIKILAALLLALGTHSHASAQSSGGIYSTLEAYYRRIDSKGIDRSTDWKWLCAVSRFDFRFLGSNQEMIKIWIEQIEKDSVKRSQGVKFFSILKSLDCWPYEFVYRIELRGTLRVNDRKDSIIVSDISSLKLFRMSTEYGSQDYRVEKIVIDISGPVTEETITEEFLKPIRDIRQTITEDLNLFKPGNNK